MSIIGEPMHPGVAPWASWLKRMALSPRSLLVREVILEGELRDGSPARLVYLGEGESLGYLKQFFSRIEGLRDDGRYPIWGLRRRAALWRVGGNLVIAEVNRLFAFLRPRDSLVSYPWVRQKVELGEGAYRCRKKRLDSNARRRIRRYGYRHELAGVEALGRFYHELYAPYIRYRYGELTHLRSYRELERALRSGFLLKVLEGEEWVAGEVYRKRGDALIFLATGCTTPYERRLRHGALAAAKYFSARWARDHGIAVIDLLRSRPHAQDGLFRHKLNLGAQASVDPWVHTALWLLLPDNRTVPPLFERLLVAENGRLSEVGGMRAEAHPVDSTSAEAVREAAASASDRPS